MKYSVYVRCGCRGPDGKLVGQDCPQLWRKDKTGGQAVGRDGSPVWVGSRHGTAGWAGRVPTSNGVNLVRRLGYATKTEAEQAAQHAAKLLDLAIDDTTRKRIGDMIAATKNGTPLPSVEDVARRVGVGLDPASTGITMGEAWHAWLAGKKRLRASSAERLELAGTHWILPALTDVPLERLNGAHVAEVFVRMERIAAEIIAQRGTGRAYIRVEGDVRTRPRPVGVAGQARAFLAATKDDPLGLLFRIVLLRGARRGEAVGLRWSDADLDAATCACGGPSCSSGARSRKARRRPRPATG